MARSLDLAVLTNEPESARDGEWEQAFFLALADSRIELEDMEPKVGPDGWPYLFAKVSRKATEPASRILDWLAARGIGLVINADKQIPDYVFPYGMIWNWKERGQFISDSIGVKSGSVELKAGQEILAGPPSFEYLPRYVRQILFQFLKGQGVPEPKVLMISHDSKNYDLCFSLESLGSPPNHEHRGIAEALAWFLPQHYSLMIVSEKGLPNFILLEGQK